MEADQKSPDPSDAQPLGPSESEPVTADVRELWDTLFSEYKDPLHVVARHLLGSSDHADEALSQFALSLPKVISILDRNMHPFPLLLKHLNLIILRMKREMERSNRGRRNGDFLELISARENNEAGLRERREAVRAAVAALSKGERHIVHLVYEKGLTNDQIAEEIVRSPRTVCRHRQDILRRLRRDLQDFGTDIG